jgi:predicted AAA+ superfamily ATPase
MDKSNYIARICDKELQDVLSSTGAVLIEGAKWCGKTSTAENIAKSALLMQDPDKTKSYQQIADTKPSLLLQGATPRLLDEWQISPVLWDAVRVEVDKRQATGQFILTGSAVPADNLTEHTGTGRIARILMRTMSLYESKESIPTKCGNHHF